MTGASFYCAQTDRNGVLCVAQIRDDDDGHIFDTDDLADFADTFPGVIYFEVTPAPTVGDVKTALRENIEKVISEVAASLISLGSSAEWSMDHNFATTEGLASLATRVGLPAAGNQDDDDLRFWRHLADLIDIEHDGEDD